jgi:SAM-dependent methyltransferase
MHAAPITQHVRRVVDHQSSLYKPIDRIRSWTAMGNTAGHCGWLIALAIGVAGCGPSSATVAPEVHTESAKSIESRPRARPVTDGRYDGRPIADTCSYLGADWLDRPDRDQREQPDRVLEALHLDPQSTAADVGAGTGYFTVRLARRVAKVFATDLQPEMLALLDARLGREHLGNVELVHAGEHDARLPAGCCDLILLVDVYHELSDPPGVMAGIRRALSERGRLVLIEYRGEDPRVPIKPEHKMSLPQIKSELDELGFELVDSLEFLPDQRVVIFTRNDRGP